DARRREPDPPAGGAGGDLLRAPGLQFGFAQVRKSLRGAPSMTTRTSWPVAAVVVFLAAACGSNPRPKSQAVPAQAPVKPAVPPAAVPLPPDPIATLIAASQRHFEAGERELRVGHLEGAKTEFDRAVDVLLESPYGARTDARLREHFDRLVDRINAYEVT